MKMSKMRQRNEEMKEPFSYVIWGTEGTHLLEIRIWTDQQGRSVCRRWKQSVIAAFHRHVGWHDYGWMPSGRKSSTGIVWGYGCYRTFCYDGWTYLSGTWDADQGNTGAVFSAKDLHATRLDHMTIETSENSTLSMLDQTVEWKIGFAGTAFDYRFINSVVVY